MKTITINLLIATLLIRYGTKPDGTPADWSIQLRLHNGFILGIGSFWGNCFSGIVLTIHKHSLKLTILYHNKQTDITLNLLKTQWLIDNIPANSTHEIIEARKLNKPLSTKHTLHPNIHWLSEHIAYKWGKPTTDPYGTETALIYQGWLGHHYYI